MAKTDKRLIGARVDEDFAERVEAAAERQERSVSSFVRHVLAAAIEPKQRQGEAA
ncbi:ribbon-helix-helix protein, CopG family [Bradyrhizobium sp. C-145]|uniref:ribbon-helix-helix protein, CopG family n=1 Tax=Bradyrhizobium sp. C-145 TaxID=574727 RepID=UPI00201B4E4B|nr:ribbon-helix-helix protein, CopG family [Bradyrhizobium sp. C-145]UQR67714.1 ribbon-helix-helix protein, CopG family [Bradyrhizobium sp. C-145]